MPGLWTSALASASLLDMHTSSSVDRLDLALLHALQIAPRASWTRIGQAIGVDPVTAARRWTRLTGEGYGWLTAYCSAPFDIWQEPNVDETDGTWGSLA